MLLSTVHLWIVRYVSRTLRLENSCRHFTDMPRGRIGALASAARRARDAKAAAAAGATKKKAQRSSTAAALIELHREFFESLSPSQYERLEAALRFLLLSRTFTAPCPAQLYAAFLAHGKSEQGFVTAKELGPLLKSLGDEPRPRELQARRSGGRPGVA